jgi:hypothetical protein
MGVEMSTRMGSGIRMDAEAVSSVLQLISRLDIERWSHKSQVSLRCSSGESNDSIVVLASGPHKGIQGI